MTDSVVAEGHVRIREGKRWRSRWVVLRKPSPVADCLVVLVYKEHAERSSGQKERSSMTLEHICGLESGLPYEAVAHSLTILCLGHSVVLGFESKEALQAWELRIRYSLGEVHRFTVSVLPGTKLESGPAALHLCNSLLAIARDHPPAVVGQWDLLDLRRYGPVPNGFVFEGGTRCGYWAGVFFLSCGEGEQISFLFDCIVRGISPSRGPPGLRPLLPDLDTCPASTEERLNQEARDLEKRMSLLSQCSQHSSAASTSSYSTSVAEDDQSVSGSSESSDSSQSDGSIGSRLTVWTDPPAHPTSVEAVSQSESRCLPQHEEKPMVNLVGGAKTTGDPQRSRKLQEIGRQGSSDSGIATGSHSSYSGSFSSYTDSLDNAAPGEEYASFHSLVPHSGPDHVPCTCPPCPGHEYQVPTSLRYVYDTPKSLRQLRQGSIRSPREAPSDQAATAGQAERGSSNSSEVMPTGAEVCQICIPPTLYMACPICGGLKGAPVPPSGTLSAPAATGQESTTVEETNQETASETRLRSDESPEGTGYFNSLSDLIGHYCSTERSGHGTNVYESMASTLGCGAQQTSSAVGCRANKHSAAEAKRSEGRVVYENCSGCKKHGDGLNRMLHLRARGSASLLAGGRNCGASGPVLPVPEEDLEKRATGARANEAGLAVAQDCRCDEDCEEEDGSVQEGRRGAEDPAFQITEARVPSRISESEVRSKYELMSSHGVQKIPYPDPEGRGSSKYAQIDITATETAHKVGTQHALGREEGLPRLEQQKNKAASPQ
ncbi:protein Dok-7 isoform X2 [Denticeps clupeoides]|uniref:PH domain-containing protein n=1 Tax=Denticeps clupeoides TaxID=299321 RepID=A0AAY4DJI8_9TELE|nr:protein Dok-7-like isoform X2 [Denticeps clupeoides]